MSYRATAEAAGASLGTVQRIAATLRPFEGSTDHAELPERPGTISTRREAARFLKWYASQLVAAHRRLLQRGPSSAEVGHERAGVGVSGPG
jgi:hypothetical protein